jgi:carboxyl-terminal processing protease
MSDQPENSPFQTRLPFYFAITLIIGLFIGQQLPRTAAHLQESNRSASTSQSVLDEIVRYVQARYVDTVDVNQLQTQAIQHILHQLDPHSVYISPEEAKLAEEDMSGGFEGIGVEFILLDDTIQVVTPIKGGPSEQAGIHAGDKMVTIDGVSVAGVKIDNASIFKKLRGPKGTPVVLGIKRGTKKELMEFTISRDRIPLNSVETAYVLAEKVGYIKINRFTANTHTEFMEALRNLVENHRITDLLLDLRGNPGGYMEEATNMLSQFFPEDKLLVYTEGRTDSRQEYKSTGRARFSIRNVAVLIDEGSASASEIVAGAIQDHDRGWVIGRRSYGKGLVQEEYPLSNSGKLRLTVARYFTPSGRSIQRSYQNEASYDLEEERRFASGELTGKGNMQVADSTPYYTGMGRVVYAGGGISPDLFIPLDTSYFNEQFNRLAPVLAPFVSRWLEQHGKEGIPTDAASFVQHFQVSDEMVLELASYALKETPVQRQQLEQSKQELKLRIKARLARLLFDQNTEYQVLNANDLAVKRALEVIQQGTPLVKR